MQSVITHDRNAAYTPGWDGKDDTPDTAHIGQACVGLSQNGNGNAIIVKTCKTWTQLCKRNGIRIRSYSHFVMICSPVCLPPSPLKGEYHTQVSRKVNHGLQT